MWACGPEAMRMCGPVDRGTYSLACTHMHMCPVDMWPCGPTDVWTIHFVDM